MSPYLPLITELLRWFNSRKERKPEKKAEAPKEVIVPPVETVRDNVEQFTLRRVAYLENCVQGVLLHRNRAILVTLEDAWKGNEPNISCIPSGHYVCKRYSSDKYPTTFEVTNVHNRSKILFHAGNTDVDTHGCILLGRRFGDLHGRPAVLESKVAMDWFREYTLNMNEFDLTIESGAWGAE